MQQRPYRRTIKTREATLVTFRNRQDHFEQNDLCTNNTLKGNVEFAHCKIIAYFS